ncbi:MAG: tetratricopeptide repeat protein, partial [Thermomicrobiales bacterium]
GELVGTLPYMSPEQVSGDTRDLDTRSDVYAVGVVLYELLADRLPYDVGKRPVVEAARVIRDEEPTRLSMIKSRLRGDVEIIVGKALEKDRDRRYQTAAELAADIRRYLSDTPIVARRPSTFYQARKFAKRHKGIVGGLGAAFLALAIGLGAALHQADEARLEARRADENKLQADEQARMAKVEADRATRRLNEVRALARAFIFDFHNEIADLPGSLPAREFLVRTALSYLNSLSAEIDDDPGFRRELALAYRQIGNLQGNPYQPNINDVEGACKSLGMSLTLLRQNAEVDPTDFHTQLDIAQTEYLLGDVLVSQRRIEEALRRYQSAADIGESLLAEDSSNRSLLSTMNVVHDRFGTLLLKLGRREEALKQRTASLKVAEQVYALDPGSIVYRANIAISRQSVARMLCDLGRQDEARAYHERAVAVFEDLAADHPGHARVLRSLIWTLSNFGQFLKDRGEFEESARVLRNAAAHAEQMIENDPLDSVAKQSLRTLYSSLAQLMNLRDRPAEALDNARKALALAESIYSTDPVNQAAAEDYAVSGVAVGQMLRRSGQSEESLPYVHRGLATLESHSRKNPMDLEVMFKLSVGLGELGHALLDLQRLQEAEALYGEKLAVSERLAAQNGGDVRCARDRANALFMLGEVHERMAEDDSLTRDHRLQFIHSARSGYQDAKAIFMELEKNQRALQQDVPLLHQTDKSIERCDRLLQELRRDPPGGEL